MKLNKGSILLETLIALIVMMIMTNSILGLNQLEVVKKDVVDKYEEGL